jgi:hypothetical protein
MKILLFHDGNPLFLWPDEENNYYGTAQLGEFGPRYVFCDKPCREIDGVFVNRDKIVVAFKFSKQKAGACIIQREGNRLEIGNIIKLG